MPNLSNGFDKLAHWTARHAGRPATFALALAIIVVWGCEWSNLPVVGHVAAHHQHRHHDRDFPYGVSDPEHTQNRDTGALQLKLDELIRVNGKARNRLLRLEELTEEEMEHIKTTFTRLAKASPALTEERGDQIG
jgi:low affinity Fe/Cu permease